MTNDQPSDSSPTNNQWGGDQKPVAGREVVRLEVIRMVWKPEDTERRNGHDHKGDHGDHVSKHYWTDGDLQGPLFQLCSLGRSQAVPSFSST